MLKFHFPEFSLWKRVNFEKEKKGTFLANKGIVFSNCHDNI